VVYFKPAGVPIRLLEEVVLALDELEALRLADLDGLYQEQAAERMKISRPTFARIVEQARRKVAEALVHGKALRLEGGAVIVTGDESMPARDGSGPMGRGPGRGRGRCGCGQRQGAQGRGQGQGRGGAGFGPGARRRRGQGVAAAAVATATNTKSEAQRT
jgi:predicted DNA-binding protein (UPF0251 family)